MEASLVSILVPLYNEEEFIGTLLERVLAAPLPEGARREIIVVDDGSTDQSAEIVSEYCERYPGVIRLVRHPSNRGKGAALRTALAQARGEFCLVQDADLEYDPREYPRLLAPLLEGRADAVFGSRFLVSGERRVLYYWHSVASHIVTALANVAADLNLTDVGSGYKAFRTSLIASIPLHSDRFGFEAEVTIKLARRQVRIYETPISYHGRTYEEGKKLAFRDGFEMIRVILRNAFTRDLYKDFGPGTLDALTGAPRLNRWMADAIRPYAGQTLLEIGAGIGNLTRVLIAQRRCYVATDVDPEHLARLETRFQNRPHLRVRRCDLSRPEDFEEFGGQMDSVVCLNVLEHVEDDMQGLRNILCALKPGGRAIILVPHDQRIFGTLDAALGHFRRYSRRELSEKMEKVGFHVERVLDFNRISWPAWYLSGKIFRQTTLKYTQMKLFDLGVWLWRRIDRLLPWPPVSIIAIGVKGTGGRGDTVTRRRGDTGTRL